MEKEKKDLYSYLREIPKLTKKIYDELVLVHGKNVVDATIELILSNNEDIIDRFDYYIELQSNNVEYVTGKSILKYYIDDIRRIPKLNLEDNERYTNEIYEIITELRGMFDSFSVKYANRRGVIFNSILDEVQFYSSLCDDVLMLNRFKVLSERFMTIRNKLVEGNLRIVIAVYKSKFKDDNSFVELLQYGNIGLMKAIEKFNPNKGTRFSTYAYVWIKQFFRMAHRNEMHTGVSVSYKAMEDNNTRLKVIENLSFELKRIPTDKEVADRMNIDACKLKQIVSAVPYAKTLSSPVYSDDGDKSVMLIDSCVDDTVDVEGDVCFKMLQEQLMQIIDNNLSEKQKFILNKRFGFDGEPLTFREIGQLLGVSKQCVEQDHAKALKKLRERSYSRLHDFID